MIFFIDTLLAFINILGWSSFPFINKYLMKNIDPLSYTGARWFLGIPIGIASAFLFKKIFSQKSNFYFLLFLLLILSFIISFVYNYLLNKYPPNLVIAVINPIVIFLTAVIGSVFFNEPFTNQMWIGFMITLFGLVIFLLGKKNNI